MNTNSNVSFDFIVQLKQQILSSRYIVAKIANAESLKLYYNAGKAIDEKANTENWGAKVLDTVSQRLQQELPGLRGFSASNLKKMRIFYQAWKNTELVGSLTSNQTASSPIPSLISVRHYLMPKRLRNYWISNYNF